MTGEEDVEVYKVVVRLVPELAVQLDSKKLTKKQITEACEAIVAEISTGDLVMRDCALGTGIEAAIKGFLPEPIYIEAVREVASQMKTSETATFGKPPKLLLDEVEDGFDDLQTQFLELQKRLSRVLDPNGEPAEDLRLEAGKGDGLKGAVAFAILRAYTLLFRSTAQVQDDVGGDFGNSFIPRDFLADGGLS
ncbi:hypothetical protein [Paenarthrobacter nitroguajacolicus]|uniref:hypothetical protein n=1 Tax=Paenarthrobacter nitroguajacolicus TaxID=211146 RepID=UPI0015BB81E6|nr:hypothetical protein [Paenarthrobacter nitroguajacolicus]